MKAFNYNLHNFRVFFLTSDMVFLKYVTTFRAENLHSYVMMETVNVNKISTYNFYNFKYIKAINTSNMTKKSPGREGDIFPSSPS